jgi:hypothetical protein
MAMNGRSKSPRWIRSFIKTLLKAITCSVNAPATERRIAIDPIAANGFPHEIIIAYGQVFPIQVPSPQILEPCGIRRAQVVLHLQNIEVQVAEGMGLTPNLL